MNRRFVAYRPGKEKSNKPALILFSRNAIMLRDIQTKSVPHGSWELCGEQGCLDHLYHSDDVVSTVSWKGQGLDP